MSLAAKYRGYAVHIGEADQPVEAFFGAMHTFWSVGVAAAGEMSAAPLLTITMAH